MRSWVSSSNAPLDGGGSVSVVVSSSNSCGAFKLSTRGVSAAPSTAALPATARTRGFFAANSPGRSVVVRRGSPGGIEPGGVCETGAGSDIGGFCEAA